MSTDGSARACGVGACARLIPTLGGPGEASGPRTDGFHWLGYPRTPPRHRGARPRRPLWVAAMACFWGDVLSKTTTPGDTGPRRLQDYWRDHGLGIAHSEPKSHPFHAPVFAISVSLDHERTKRSSYTPCSRAGRANVVGRVNFFLGYVPDRNTSGTGESRARTVIS